MQERPFLSIIIPAFNEELRLPDSLMRVVSFIKAENFVAEVIVVDNASTDLTKDIILDFSSRYPFCRYCQETKRGKGAAVRTGILAGQGDYLLICDADLAVPIEEASKFLPSRLGDYDIAIASREKKGAKRHNEPFYRHLMGRIFNFIVRILLLPGLHDTQCGFKCFKREVAHSIFKTSSIDGWGFDVEILYKAALNKYKIIEVPVNWYYGDQSKINPFKDSWNMFKEIVQIRGNLFYKKIFSQRPPVNKKGHR